MRPTQENEEYQKKLDQIRREFNQGFSTRPSSKTDTLGKFLVIRAQDSFFSLALEDIQGVHLVKKIIPLPKKASGLLGLGPLNGQLVAFFDLAFFLGLTPTTTNRAARRPFILGGDQERAALVFDSLEGIMEFPQEDILPLPAGEKSFPGPHHHLKGLIKTPKGPSFYLDFPSLLAAVKLQMKGDQ